jgi:hypothetical protein
LLVVNIGEVGIHEPTTTVLLRKGVPQAIIGHVLTSVEIKLRSSAFPNGAFFGTTSRGKLAPPTYLQSFGLVSRAHHIRWSRNWRRKCSDNALKLQAQPRDRTGATVSFWLSLRLPEVVRRPSSRHARRRGFQVQVHTKGQGDDARGLIASCRARDKECPYFKVINGSWKLLRRPS